MAQGSATRTGAATGAARTGSAMGAGSLGLAQPASKAARIAARMRDMADPLGSEIWQRMILYGGDCKALFHSRVTRPARYRGRQ